MPAPRRPLKPERSILKHAPLLMFFLVLAFCAFPRQAAAGQNSAAPEASRARKESAAPGKTLWLIPHTHWEGAVFKTRSDNTFQFDLSPYEIKTFKLKLQPNAARK